MLYEKILIVGQTKEGKKFRPSDWAERLYYTVASYGKNGRVIFNPLVITGNHPLQRASLRPSLGHRLPIASAQ